MKKEICLKQALFLVLGILIGVGICHYGNKVSVEEHSDLRSGVVGWVNPLLECNPSIREGAPQIRTLKGAVDNYINPHLEKKKNVSVSVYYKDLNSGAWFGVNNELLFAVASLSKVPLIAKIYKLSESNPELLNKKIVYNPQEVDLKNIDNNVEKEHQLVQGQEYSVQELLEKMIIHSDNISTVVLVKHLKIDLGKMFKDFGIVYYRENGLLNLTTKSYGAIFRILYNST